MKSTSESNRTKEIHAKIIAKINLQIGSDFANLHKSKELICRFREDFESIEAKLSTTNTIVSSGVKTSLNNATSTGKAISVKIHQIEEFETKISQRLQEQELVLKEVDEPLEKIRNLEHLVEYFRIVQDIVDISNALKSSVNGKDEQKIVGHYLSLCGEIHSSESILDRLEKVEAFHLKSFAIRTAVYWYEILKERFSKDFEGILKTIKWPFSNTNLDNSNISKESLNKLSILAEYLFLIKPPGDLSNTYITITPSIVCPPISKPVLLLLKPFRQRFLYHFSGTKQTNRLDKPEWYYTQILQWAKENHKFVGSQLQPAALLAGYENFNVRLEFIRGLVQLAIEKLCIDCEEIVRDEHLFAHLLDETLSFEQELRETLSYPQTFPNTLRVLTQAQYFTKWLTAEKNFSDLKMDAMLKTGNPWQYIEPTNMEELKIPICADQFIRLLDAIKERYCMLQQPGHQLQFLNLQLDLIDSFRRRLVQLHSSSVDNVTSTTILNAVNYINSVLKEWGENVHYLHLHAALVGPDADEINSVFDKPIGELDHWQKQITRDLANKVVDEIKAKSMHYRHDNWVSMAEQNAREPFILSITGGEMFQIMVTLLHNLETELSTNIFNIILRMIAQQLDTFFIDNMIMNTKFSTGGAAQFHFDMKRNLFPLFGQYIQRPEVLFKKISDACTLLVLPQGNALLLHQTLQRKEDTAKNHKNALNEIGVRSISSHMAIDLLARRTDVVSY